MLPETTVQEEIDQLRIDMIDNLVDIKNAQSDISTHTERLNEKLDDINSSLRELINYVRSIENSVTK